MGTVFKRVAGVVVGLSGLTTAFQAVAAPTIIKGLAAAEGVVLSSGMVAGITVATGAIAALLLYGAYHLTFK